MSLTLSGSINARTRQIVVTGTVPAGIRAGYLFGLDDEVLAFQTFRHQWPEQEDRQTWRVLRGVGGSKASSHSNGTTILAARDGYARAAGLTPPDPFIEGGTSISADIVAALEAADPPLDADNPPLTGLAITQTAQSSLEVTTNETTTVLGVFASGDVGKVIAAPGFESGVTVVSVVPGVSAVVSLATTASATVTATLSGPAPAGNGPGSLWLEAFANPEGGSDLFGILRVRNATDDGWENPALATVDTGGNLVSVQAEGSAGVVAMYVRRPDATYITQVYLSSTAMKITASDDNLIAIQIVSSNFAGDVLSQIVITPAGVAVTTGGTFTYNGSEVAVVA